MANQEVKELRERNKRLRVNLQASLDKAHRLADEFRVVKHQRAELLDVLKKLAINAESYDDPVEMLAYIAETCNFTIGIVENWIKQER